MSNKGLENLSANRYWYFAAALVLVITIILGYLVFSIQPVDRDLKVDKVFFKSVEYGDDDTDLKILVFLTNNGESEIENVKVRAFAIERDSNLARSEDTVTIGTISGQTTEEGELSINVPNRDSYRIELLVFEDSKMTIRGSGTIDLRNVGVDENDTQGDGSPSADPFVLDGDEDGASLLAESTDSSFILTGICLLLIPGIVIVIIIIAVYNSNKNKKTNVPPPQFKNVDKGRNRAEPFEGFTKIEDFHAEEEIEKEEKE